MSRETHIRKVCGAAVHLLSQRKGEALTFLGRPDKDERQKEAVDWIYKGESTEFVLEHTLIESVPGQIKDSMQFSELLGPLEKELKGYLPEPGYYTLAVNFGAVEGAKDAERIREALKTWIIEKAPTLEVRSPDTIPYCSIREVPPGVSFEVELSRCRGSNGKLFIMRFSPTDLEEQRKSRIREAFGRKCPKLQRARGKTRRSLLVLESDDIALANAHVVGEAVIEELKFRQDDIPDDVYLIETDIEDHWILWVLKEGEVEYPNINDDGPHRVYP